MLAKPFRWVAGVTPTGYSLEEQSVEGYPFDRDQVMAAG